MNTWRRCFTTDMPNPINTLPLAEAFERLVDAPTLDRLIRAAMLEDLGVRGDITSVAMIDEQSRGAAVFSARNSGVLSGGPVIKRVAELYCETMDVEIHLPDGHTLQMGDLIATYRGPLRVILAAERVALNFLTHLSGIATLTATYVRAVEGTNARIYDTRKTVPGLRAPAKYAVRCGGGFCHRVGLYDAMLVKDNHLAHVPLDQLSHVLSAAIITARSQPSPPEFVEVEVDTLDQLKTILPLDVNIVLLDNMTIDQLRQAVAMRDKIAPKVQLEASGGVNLQTVRAIAETGVDRVAVGAITHSAPALDIGLDIQTA